MLKFTPLKLHFEKENMKFVSFLLLVFSSSVLFSQLNELRGVWISNTSAIVAIRDVDNDLEDGNIIGKNTKEISLNVFLKGDVLSFQKKYYTEESNFTQMMVDSFDLKIISKDQKTLVLKPSSSLAKKFFKTSKKISFIKQDYFLDTSVTFEKIVFHTSGCVGSCPIIDLEINSEKQIYLQGIFYKDFSIYEIDEKLSGQFTGVLDESIVKRINYLLQTCNLKELTVNEELEPEVPVTYIIVYYNGGKKAFKFTTTPAILSDMVEFLSLLNQEIKLTKTMKRRMLETY